MIGAEEIRIAYVAEYMRYTDRHSNIHSRLLCLVK